LLIANRAWQFLTKLTILSPYNPAIRLLGICPNELKTYFHAKICTQVFIISKFITAQTWKLPRCPLQQVNGYINCGTSKQ
jgi:hypothetical protein